MELNFLTELHEARMTRNTSDNSKLSYTDCCERLACKITNTDYKTIRRAVTNWDRLSGADKKKWVTKLLLASRAKLRNSDIIMYLEELARKANLEDTKVKDNEPTVSKPDMVPTTAQDLALY